MKQDKVEVELRAPISRSDKLKFDDFNYVGSYHELDTYYEIDRSWVSRIRKRTNEYYLTFKSSKRFGEGSWNEVEFPITKSLAVRADRFFLENGFSIKAVIDKKRKSFRKGRFELNIDVIKGLGKFIEIELLSDRGEVDSSKKKIEMLMSKVGINPAKVSNLGYVSIANNAKA